MPGELPRLPVRTIAIIATIILLIIPDVDIVFYGPIAESAAVVLRLGSS